MKILIFAAFYHPYKGGYVESIHGLAKRLVQKGHLVKVLTCNTNHKSGKDLIDGIEVIRINCWNPKWLNKTFPIPKFSSVKPLWLLTKENFDIISTQTRFYPTTWLGFLFAKFRGIPCIHTERGAGHAVSDNFLIRGVGLLTDYTLGWIIFRFSDRIVGVSEAVCDFVRRLGAKHPITIYNGINVDFWENNGFASPLKSCLPAGRGKTVITFVGRLVYAKGVQDLLSAAADLSYDFVLNVVGDGPYKGELIKISDNLKISDKVNFLGELTQEEVRQVLHQTDIFVNPSYSEGLPRSVLEAAAVGLPIIATDVGGTKEIDELREKFNWDNIVNQYEKTFSSVSFL